MDTEHFKTKLLHKRAELIEEINRLTDEARDPGVEVQDPMDYVSSSEARAAAFQISSTASDILGQVEAALERIEDGTYGTSIESGDPIGEARLEAVPWTPYTLEEQERQDRLNRDKQQASQLESAS